MNSLRFRLLLVLFSLSSRSPTRIGSSCPGLDHSALVVHLLLALLELSKLLLNGPALFGQLNAVKEELQNIHDSRHPWAVLELALKHRPDNEELAISQERSWGVEVVANRELFHRRICSHEDALPVAVAPNKH